MMESMRIKRICSSLGISEATFRNWEKENIIPEKECDFDEFVDKIKQNAQIHNKLSARANRFSSVQRTMAFHGIKKSERKKILIKTVEKSSDLPIQAAVLSLIICQLKTEKLIPQQFENGPIPDPVFTWLKETSDSTKTLPQTIYNFYNAFEIPNENDDFLGAFYQSLQSVGEKAGKGSFYTPHEILETITIPAEDTVYDPCCGSGAILLGVLGKNHPAEKVYASDIDKTALMICHANLIMFFADLKAPVHIFECNFLNPENIPDGKINRKYDFIITNPPWGAKTSLEEKKYLSSLYPLETSESFSICLYNASKMLSDVGKMLFFLPAAFLNVAAHKKIREYILSLPATLSVKLLGTAFKNVFSKSIILQVDLVKKSQKILVQQLEDKNTCKNQQYFVSTADCCGENSVWPVFANPKEMEMLEKIYNFPHIFLSGKENCLFGMGIVTGNNKNFIKSADFLENEYKNLYRGKNIQPYSLEPPVEKILYKPELFHQSAPGELYLQKKIVYRFISNRIICAVSKEGELFLNSANFFIPQFDYPWETIVALFNSDLYAFLFQKKFDSVKVLRQHLEQLPLPLFTQQQHKQIYNLYLQIADCREQSNKITLQNQMEKLIRSFLEIN